MLHALLVRSRADPLLQLREPCLRSGGASQLIAAAPRCDRRRGRRASLRRAVPRAEKPAAGSRGRSRNERSAPSSWPPARPQSRSSTNARARRAIAPPRRLGLVDQRLDRGGDRHRVGLGLLDHLARAPERRGDVVAGQLDDRQARGHHLVRDERVRGEREDDSDGAPPVERGQPRRRRATPRSDVVEPRPRPAIEEPNRTTRTSGRRSFSSAKPAQARARRRAARSPAGA